MVACFFGNATRERPGASTGILEDHLRGQQEVLESFVVIICLSSAAPSFPSQRQASGEFDLEWKES